jgi:3-hydroxybutyryl-CoA dehydrogenase
MGVVGAGTMGNGIAHVFARAGYEVVLYDIEQKFLDRALTTIGKNLDREVAKNKISEAQKAEALGLIFPAVDRSRLSACDFIVEAASERLEVKSELFRDLDRVCRPRARTESLACTFLIPCR